MREQRDLPLREVAEAAGMDLTHLHKIELGQRLPTEAQTVKLAKFFKLDETETQARRIAEEFRRYYATKRLPLVTRIPVLREFLVSAVAVILRKQPGSPLVVDNQVHAAAV